MDGADTQSINSTQTQPTLDEEDISCNDEDFSDASEPPQSPLYNQKTDTGNKKRNLPTEYYQSDTPETSRSSTSCSRTFKVKKKQDTMQAGMEERSKQRMELLQGICKQKEDDEVDLFFKSIALKVKTLPPHLITELQMKVLSVVSDFQSRAYAAAPLNIIIEQPSAKLNTTIQEQNSLLEGYSLVPPGSEGDTDNQNVLFRL